MSRYKLQQPLRHCTKVSTFIGMSIFPSFFLSGFECSTFRWKDKRRRNLITESQHDIFADSDYRMLQALGIGGAREAIAWPFVDNKGQYDFSSVDPMIDALNKYKIFPIWDLCHYGYPDDLDPFSEKFVDRFADYCKAAAKYVSERMDGPYFFSPINEITYFSFIGGEWGWAAPYGTTKQTRFELRKNLCKASIAAVHAIRSVIPSARMIHMDPVIQVVAPHNRPDLKATAHHETYVDTYAA
ncbi:MAG TPA: family 1 glycosylhydrolase, partial [Chitinophagaceae bacterium]|nr:family 1 glycosylhydrolase [Chitinophagaceae bacterium]